MPLVRSFALSTKPGRQAWVEPIIDQVAKRVAFTVKTGAGKPLEGTVGKRGAICLCCNAPVPLEYIRGEGRAKRMATKLMAIVAEAAHGRTYLKSDPIHESAIEKLEPVWTPDTELPEKALSFRVQMYGMTTHADLFTPRQLVALSTLSDLVSDARTMIYGDARLSGLDDPSSHAHADAVATYLGLGVSRSANTICSLAVWSQGRDQSVNVFSRQALPMTWDFPEVNPFAGAAGDFGETTEAMSKVISKLKSGLAGRAIQEDATSVLRNPIRPLICTDPPYYDNVGYADLSDFFYVWLRRAISKVYPTLFHTMLVPKAEELIATPYRFGGDKNKAKLFFERGLARAFNQIRLATSADFPVTIFYAFKQSEGEDGDDSSETRVVASTGWETMLQGLISAGFQVTGTWPMRTERPTGVKLGFNVLASSIILVCRPRPEDSPTATRREFINALRRELEDALLKMMHGNVAPVDLAQATIGPGMAVYSRFSKVVETDGSPLRVRTALQLINQELDAILSSQEGEYDTDTRFCLAWFEQFGVNGGAFGEADVMARAKNTSVQGLEHTGVLEAKAGRVRLLKREEYSAEWNHKPGEPIPVWECTQQLVRALLEQGEGGAARLCAALNSRAEPARDLSYRLYSICERKGWAQEALAYNSLVIAWPEITRLASNPNIAVPQTGLFAGGEA